MARRALTAALTAMTIVFAAAYAVIAVRAGNTVYQALDVYAMLSADPLEGIIGSLALVLASALVVLSSIGNKSHNNDSKLMLLVLIVSVGVVATIRFIVPDIAMRYYITDFEDSNHMASATYIALYGHINPFSYAALNRAAWLTFSQVTLALWGRPAAIKGVSYHFIIKWWPEFMMLMMAPAVYSLARSVGLGRWASAAAVLFSTLLWPEFPQADSQHYGTLTFTIALAAFALALRERDRRSLVLVSIASLALVFTHELVAALAAVAFIGGSLMVVLYPSGLPRRSAVWPLASSLGAYLVMALYDSGSFVTQGISFYWNVTIRTLKELLSRAPSVLSSAAYRPLPAYHAAVELKAATYIAELVVPFVVLLALSVKDHRFRFLFGALGLAGLLGAALTLGLGAVGWADRVPVMMVGLSGVAMAGLLEIRRHRRAALAAAVVLMSLLAPLAFYASFAGYPAETFYDLEPQVETPLLPAAPGFQYVALPIPCTNGSSWPLRYVGPYEVYWPFVNYFIYTECPYPSYVYAYLSNVVANASSVVLDSPSGFVGETAQG